MQDKSKDVLQPVDDSVRRLAKSLVRSARFAALGTIDQADGAPSVSRISLATMICGSPGFLISRLSSHFGNLEADRRCSLLVGEPGKGDPLAHPRMTLIGRAYQLNDAPSREAFSRRYLMRHPKAALYAGFADFAFWRFEISRASLNGGFGKAYALAPADLLSEGASAAALSEIEQGAVEHMNSDHKTAVDHYAHMAGGTGDGWQLACLDGEGLDLVRGDQCVRLWFPEPVLEARDLRQILVDLTRG